MSQASEVVDIQAKFEAEQTIIAGMCVSAPNVEIRDCLHLYNLRNRTRQHRNELIKCNKSTLVEVLNFLEISSHEQYTKPTSINSLICRVQNLLPDLRNICGENYCLKLKDKPLLECEICGQGSHNGCVLKSLTVPEEEQEAFTAEQANAATSFQAYTICGESAAQPTYLTSRLAY